MGVHLEMFDRNITKTLKSWQRHFVEQRNKCGIALRELMQFLNHGGVPSLTKYEIREMMERHQHIMQMCQLPRAKEREPMKTITLDFLRLRNEAQTLLNKTRTLLDEVNHGAE